MELLEREAQQAVLNAALSEAKAGSGRVALVSGEAGIGKTSLVEWFSNRQQGTVRVLWGACDSLFTPRPLGPLHDMATRPGAQIQGDLPKLLATDESAAAFQRRSQLFSSVLGELQRQPTIAVFEDVHWADDASLDLLRYLTRRIANIPALLVLTYRDDELGLQHPLRGVLGDLAASPAARRIQLAPLSEKAVRLLLGERKADAAALHRQTGGNPFYLTEVLADESSRMDVRRIPINIRDVVLARVARLSLSGRAVLEAAAIIGLRIEPWLLADVVGAEAPAADECIAAGMLLAQNNVLVFRHELTRLTILDSISPPRKHVLHRLVLEALKKAPALRKDLARLAHHAGAANDRQAVLEYAPPAARHAAAAGAHRESAALYALALRFAADLQPSVHASYLEDYARENNLTERHNEAIAAQRRAAEIWEQLDQRSKQGETLAILAILLRNHGNNAEAEQINQLAVMMLEALPPGRELALAYRVNATLCLSRRDYADAIAWGEKAIAVAERFDDSNNLAMAHIAVGSAWLFLDYERGCEYLERRLEIARESGRETHIANLYAYIGSCSAELYQFRRAERYLAEGFAYTIDRGLEIFARYIMGWQALTFIHLGRWKQAAEVTRQLAQNLASSAISRIPVLAATGLLQSLSGEPGGQAALAEALELAERTGTLQHLGLVRTARAGAAWLDGSPERALAEARANFDLALEKKHAWMAGELAFWRWRAGDKLELPGWLAAPFVMQIAGDWRKAADEWERLGCPYERARALSDGDLQAQIEALETFEFLGARPAADQLRLKIKSSGADRLPPRPRASTRKNPFGLTNRQLEILALLVEGLSNADIAARLHISPKTADHHVSAVLQHLDVSSREAAASLARRHGLPTPIIQ